MNLLQKLHSSRPNGSTGHEDEQAARWNHRATLGVIGVLGLTELVVAIAVSPVAGFVLLAFTGGLGALTHRGERFAAATRQRAMQAYGEQQADALRYDAATGLPNRQLLLDQVEREIARSERYKQSVTLAVAEIARFSDIEAAWGKDIAVQAVNHVVETLKRVVRTSDYVARIDGERFAIVLLQCDEEQSAQFADRLTLAVSNRPLLAGRGGKLPIYVNVDVTTRQYSPERFRGPLEWLSAAGGETGPRPVVTHAGRAAVRTGGHPLREQLIRDYYPEGEADDFALAYKRYRGQRAG